MKAKIEKRKSITKPAKKKSLQYVERSNVHFVGLDIVSPEKQDLIKKIIHDHFIEIERELNQLRSLKVHFKLYQKGRKKKYSVQLLIDAHPRPITVNKMCSPVQWDAVAITHKLIEKAKEEIKHKFKKECHPSRSTRRRERVFIE